MRVCPRLCNPRLTKHQDRRAHVFLKASSRRKSGIGKKPAPWNAAATQAGAIRGAERGVPFRKAGGDFRLRAAPPSQPRCPKSAGSLLFAWPAWPPKRLPLEIQVKFPRGLRARSPGHQVCCGKFHSGRKAPSRPAGQPRAPNFSCRPSKAAQPGASHGAKWTRRPAQLHPSPPPPLLLQRRRSWLSSLTGSHCCR